MEAGAPVRGLGGSTQFIGAMPVDLRGGCTMHPFVLMGHRMSLSATEAGKQNTLSERLLQEGVGNCGPGLDRARNGWISVSA